MKVLKKKDVIQENLLEHTKVEREIMLSVIHPFIITLNFAFQTENDLHFVLDYIGGGSLLQILNQTKEYCLAEKDAKFYAAEILLGLEALHENNIIYRDLKLENILIGADGHSVLTDFGLSAKLREEQTKVKSFSGTAIYLAPEILTDEAGHGHGKSVDWWGFGVLLYVLFTGTPPFWSENQKELFDKIAKDEFIIDSAFKDSLSDEAKNLLHALLEKDISKRLGCGAEGTKEVKNHPFFNDVDWDAVYRKELTPPIVPAFDVAEEAKKLFENEKLNLGKSSKTDRRFKGFSFVGSQHQLQQLGLSREDSSGSFKSSQPSQISNSGEIRKKNKKLKLGIARIKVNDSSIIDKKRNSGFLLEAHLKSRPAREELEDKKVFALSEEGQKIEEEQKKKKRKGFFEKKSKK